jgi:adenine deaminase
LLPLLNAHNSQNCSFATDDKLAGDLVSEGHIDHAVRVAIKDGIAPITALQIATINTARHYRLQNLGAIAPRYWADFIVCDDLKKLRIRQVYKKGVLVAEDGKYLAKPPARVPLPRSTINLRFRPKDFLVPARRGKIRVIQIIPDQIVTREAIETPKIEAQQLVADPTRDILKMVVIERHRATGNVGVGFVRGFKLTRGAIGSTVAHDAHNVVVVGTNDADMLRVVQELEKLQGGQVAVADGKVLAALALPVAGLVSDRPLAEVMRRITALNTAAQQMGCDLNAPFMTLSFLSLSPIPALKLTDQGLIDASQLRKTTLFV